MHRLDPTTPRAAAGAGLARVSALRGLDVGAVADLALLATSQPPASQPASAETSAESGTRARFRRPPASTQAGHKTKNGD